MQQQNLPNSISRYTKIARRVLEGLPYARKEAARMLSMQTGLVLATPAIYYIIVSDLCNALCDFCWIPAAQARGEKMEGLSREAILRIPREAKELSGSGFNVQISGGEPLIYRHIYDLLELAHELGINLGFTTNGYLLRPENVKRILKSNPFNINISLESIDPQINEHKRVRPVPGGTLMTMQGIENVLEEKRRTGARTRVFIKPTITEYNYRSLPALVRYFGKDSAALINMQPVVNQDHNNLKNDDFWIKDVNAFEKVVEELVMLRAEGYGVLNDPAELRSWVDYFRADVKSTPQHNGDHFRRCQVGFHSMTIRSNGNVYICAVPDVGKVVGNVNSGMSLKEMWYGKIAMDERKMISQCRRNCQLSCNRPIRPLTKITGFLKG